MLQLDFKFDNYSELNPSNIEKNEAFQSKAVLTLNSFIGEKNAWGTNETYKNPIGQTNMAIVVLIYADREDYKIIVNEGDDRITYKYRLPPWAINYILASLIIYRSNYYGFRTIGQYTKKSK